MLARLAAADPGTMAFTRSLLNVFLDTWPHGIPAEQEETLSAHWELAALPASMVPMWAASVRGAAGDAARPTAGRRSSA